MVLVVGDFTLSSQIERSPSSIAVPNSGHFLEAKILLQRPSGFSDGGAAFLFGVSLSPGFEVECRSFIVIVYGVFFDDFAVKAS